MAAGRDQHANAPGGPCLFGLAAAVGNSDIVSPQLVVVSYDDLVDTLGERLFDHRTGRGQYLLYNVGRCPGLVSSPSSRWPVPR